MIKKIVFLLALVPTLLFAKYKDVLVTKDGKVIECEVTNVDSVNVYIDIHKNGNFLSTIAPLSTVKTIKYSSNSRYLKSSGASQNQMIGDSINVSTILDFSALPEKHFKVELGFNPFGDGSVFDISRLRFKYVLDKNISLRCGVNINYKGGSRKAEDYDSNYRLEEKERTLLLGISPGIEFSFLTSAKVKPYWGVELFYNNKMSDAEYTNVSSTGTQGSKTKINGAWKEVSTRYYDGTYPSYGYSYYTTIVNEERGYFSFGANTFLGADYFITKNLYLGFELGLGYSQTTLKKITETDFSPAGAETDKAYSPSYRESTLSFYSSNSFRLGIYF